MRVRVWGHAKEKVPKFAYSTRGGNMNLVPREGLLLAKQVGQERLL